MNINPTIAAAEDGQLDKRDAGNIFERLSTRREPSNWEGLAETGPKGHV
jgi:hypothetical protein